MMWYWRDGVVMMVVGAFCFCFASLALTLYCDIFNSEILDSEILDSETVDSDSFKWALSKV